MPDTAPPGHTASASVQQVGSSGFGLVFAPTHRPEGFTSGHLAGFDGSPEPIVREMLQNSLDAARDANQPVARVRFTITGASKDQIPGWGSYCQAFEAAAGQRNERRASHDEDMVIARIRAVLGQSEVPLLLCDDNGTGLDGERMDAVLTSGNTSKGTAGAGSFGLGHHAAFAASDLRYVLYASRYRRNGTSETLASGHAILATFANSGELCAADGYLCAAGADRPAFDATTGSYPEQIPGLLDERLPETTGTVVCVVGFHDFRADASAASDSISQVAAANFCAAISQRQMTVDIDDLRTGRSARVDHSTIGGILETHAANKKAARQGQVSGRVAHAAYRTLTTGCPLDAGIDGVGVMWRPLHSDERPMTRVHVFRRGMWITSTDARLAAGLSGCCPIDAALVLDDGPLEDLVRRAEGPEHRGIERRRLTAAQKAQMRDLLGKVTEALADAAGSRDDTGDYAPPGFAHVGGHVVTSAEVQHRRRRTSGGSKSSTTFGGTKRKGSRRGKRSRGRPRPGARPAYRSVLRPGGDERIVEARVAYNELLPAQHLGLRLQYASGGDATCESPLPAEDLDIGAVIMTTADGDHIAAGEPRDRWEMLLPAPDGECDLVIELGSPVQDLSLVEIDIVIRDHPDPLEDADTGAVSA